MTKAAARQQRQRETLIRQQRSWLVVVGIILVILTVGRWFLTSRGTSSNGSPISRLSTRDFHALAFSPTQPDTIYFGHHSGLMVSRDGGRTWQPASLQNADAMALAAPPSNPQVMYAAGHDVLVKSTDGGANWHPLTTNLPGTDIHGFAADPQNAEHVYAHVVGFGIWGSQDGGATWALLSATAPQSTFNLIVGQDIKTLYAAAGEAGLFKSADGGKTWSRLSGAPGGGAMAIAYDHVMARLYVTTLGNGAGLNVSSDNAATWSALNLTGTLLAVAVSPQDSKHLLVVDDAGRVYSSTDAGATWSNK